MYQIALKRLTKSCNFMKTTTRPFSANWNALDHMSMKRDKCSKRMSTPLQRTLQNLHQGFDAFLLTTLVQNFEKVSENNAQFHVCNTINDICSHNWRILLPQSNNCSFGNNNGIMHLRVRNRGHTSRTSTFPSYPMLFKNSKNSICLMKTRVFSNFMHKHEKIVYNVLLLKNCKSGLLIWDKLPASAVQFRKI